MSEFLNFFFSIFNHWGYWIILAITILESFPIFGAFVPGQTTVMVGGFLVKLGILNMWSAILIAAFGAVTGDLISYLLGKNYGYSFLTKYGKYFFFKKEYYEKTKELMDHHAKKSLIIGRFNPLTRAFVPFIAGSTKLPFPRFMLYNIISGTIWAIFFIMIGFIFGESYEIASKYIGKFFFIAVVISILFITIYKFINKRKRIFVRRHLFALMLNISSLYLLSKMIEDVMDKELFIKLDIWINTKIVLLHGPLLNKVIIFITNLASPYCLLVLALILFGILIYKEKWYSSFLLLFSMTGGSLFEILIKIIIHKTRPENSLIDVAGYSFPSGHATMAIIFFSLLIYSFKDDIKNKILRFCFTTGNILLFLVIGFSRIYLNVHWFSDVIAGFSLGLFWLTLLILVFKILKNKPTISNLVK